MVQEKCIRLSALIVAKNVRFLLYLHQDDQSTVENATPSIGDFNHR